MSGEADIADLVELEDATRFHIRNLSVKSSFSGLTALQSETLLELGDLPNDEFQEEFYKQYPLVPDQPKEMTAPVLRRHRLARREGPRWKKTPEVDGDIDLPSPLQVGI
ncbi:hypothetical protein ABW19_dt0200436 [Dactylella cylindrospora]|nr:hypothetical protein ABW19_dt0200436 [Dactylella cylindrospora]